jgi:1-phosphatidylinositol-3-phosphate 5-kinase
VFDLKGIQGCKVNSAASKTLFDSEWIEGQQRALTLVNPVSKAILREATRADCDFLLRSNVMDYLYDYNIRLLFLFYFYSRGS